MAKNLVIVESPAKAKTIEGFLGKDFVVKSSFGHIRDLSPKKMGIEIENNFKPVYEISKDKKDLVKKLQVDVKKAETVWLATDEDREGEAIAWHLFEALGLAKKEVKRIVFHEITKKAILNAIETPREINIDLVDAQQARRVLDRLVGFELSPVLWRKVQQGLSAGRVQSVAVKLIAEREKEIRAFEFSSTFKIVGQFKTEEGIGFKAELNTKPKGKEEAERILEFCKDAIFSVEDIVTKPSKKSPAKPFTTSTLQQEASRKLSFSVAQTMSVAQRLYESGKITYMRTDSISLSQEAIDAAEVEIKDRWGEDYSNPRQYHTKQKGAQEAHEAIRPTYMNYEGGDLDRNERRLYELIWKRTLASQMSDAKLEKTTAKIGLSNFDRQFVAKGEVLVFDGFLKVYQVSTDDEEEEDTGRLPKMTEKEVLGMDEIQATERFSKHPPRYNEASLVRKMEELGIGRPSTYAPTISTIQRRKYVVKEDRPGNSRNYLQLSLKDGQIITSDNVENWGQEKQKLFPTDIGMVVNDFLTLNFEHILDYHFTAEIEDLFDEIAQGKQQWNNMIAEFYKDFHPKVEDVSEHSERVSGARELGDDPKTGKPVIVRIGRYGPMAQLGEASDDENAEKPKFASLRNTQSIETITLEEALELFKLPRQVGEYEDKVVTVAIGRFGPYIRHDNKFVSLGKEYDPLDVDLSTCVELIEAKRKADREKFIKSFEEEPIIEVLNGRWGPYIRFQKKNFKIPKDVDPKELTREDCEKLIKEGGASKKGAKKPAAKKATTKKATEKKK
jgi:DNA topoisomerase-1